MQSLTRPNGSVTTYQYDLLNRLTQMTTTVSGSTISQYACTYNAQDLRDTESFIGPQRRAAHQYDPFGKPETLFASVTQPMGFSTKAYDHQTGLSYYGFRYYSPSLGRWITRDPLGETGGINLYGSVNSIGKPLIGTNLYVYASNNPINRIDPLGLFDNPLPKLPTFSSTYPDSDYAAPFADIIAGGLEGGFATACAVATGVTFLSGPEFWFEAGFGAFATFQTGLDSFNRISAGIDRLGRD